MFDKEFLKILACPLCKTDVFVEDNYVICAHCRRKFPIKDGIPIMLVEEAELNEKDKTK